MLVGEPMSCWVTLPFCFRIYESERELFEELNALVLLTTNESFCLEFLKSETAMSLAALLEHENLAIVVCSLKFFNEIIDVDENSNSRNSFLDDLFAMLLKLPLVELIFVLFRRSAETVMLEDEDYIEAFHLGFQLLQNLLELNASDVVDSLNSSTLLKSLITWFIENLNLNFDADIGAFVNIVPCLVAETLLSLITASEKARIIFCNGGGIKCLLDLLAHYTVALPKSGDEGEYVENLFDILCSALFLESSKREFVDFNGFDMLASIYANSKKKNTEKVLKALDFAITTPNGHEFICNFVFSSSKNPGLSIPFECLRSSSIPIFERSVSVIFSLLMFARTKSLEKNCKTILLCFCADNFSLILTLLSQRQGYVVKFTQLRQEFLELSDEDFREIQYEEGLLTLQQIDIILLCCCDNIIPHV